MFPSLIEVYLIRIEAFQELRIVILALDTIALSGAIANIVIKLFASFIQRMSRLRGGKVFRVIPASEQQRLTSLMRSS